MKTLHSAVVASTILLFGSATLASTPPTESPGPQPQPAKPTAAAHLVLGASAWGSTQWTGSRALRPQHAKKRER